ncbi:MAG TPA: hypothetical protein VFI17_06735 [Solirubrobacterales bacterium]|nr:hypothetical protein [Solirubrobacterales bacterium]
MSLPRLTRPALLACILAVLAAAGATAAMVQTPELTFRADGGFRPQSLPRHRYAPIEFHGYADVAARNGGRPSPLRQAVIDFDHDGRLSVGGLPTCGPDSVAAAGTAEARRICRGAIVGSGRVEALVTLPQGTVPVSAPLTLFNGPREDGHPTVLLHARTSVPSVQTYAITIPVERRPGRYRYRATVNLPPLAGGYGSLTRLEVEIGRRYRSGGRKRSYVSARCSDNILETHGRFSFEDGLVIDGSVERYCHAK